jgi:hypothetical protein
MARGEHAAERPSVGERHEQRTLASHGIQDSPEVVHALLDREEAVSADTIRQARSPVVEADEPPESPQPLRERRHARQPAKVLEL